jgi:transcriptional regulator with XRE-family HTH domain
MPNTKNDAWKSWGIRLRVHLKEKRQRPVGLAAKMGISESAMRSWINGNREINLSDFMALCSAAGADPRQILFGSLGLTVEQRQVLGQAVASILDTDTAINVNYPGLVKSLQADLNTKRKKSS